MIFMEQKCNIQWLCNTVPLPFVSLWNSSTSLLNSDVQGFVNPPRVRGKGQEGKGQGKDFVTLNKPLTLLKGQGFFKGFISLISR